MARCFWGSKTPVDVLLLQMMFIIGSVRYSVSKDADEAKWPPDVSRFGNLRRASWQVHGIESGSCVMGTSLKLYRMFATVLYPASTVIVAAGILRGRHVCLNIWIVVRRNLVRFCLKSGCARCFSTNGLGDGGHVQCLIWNTFSGSWDQDFFPAEVHVEEFVGSDRAMF